MSNLLRTGMEFLQTTRKAFLADEVTYTRGSDSITSLKATHGKTTYESTNSEGVVVGAVSDDFIVTAEDLVISGNTIEPRVGDTITDGDRVFAVMNIAGEGCWRNSDPFGLAIRIHTKQVS